ncbi:MAG: hypothetical protein ACK5JT_16695 [Hyphomicrobiaceae bacterium]
MHSLLKAALLGAGLVLSSTLPGHAAGVAGIAAAASQDLRQSGSRLVERVHWRRSYRRRYYRHRHHHRRYYPRFYIYSGWSRRSYRPYRYRHRHYHYRRHHRHWRGHRR